MQTGMDGRRHPETKLFLYGKEIFSSVCVFVCYSFTTETYHLEAQLLVEGNSEWWHGLKLPHIVIDVCFETNIKCLLECLVRHYCHLQTKGNHHEVNNSIAFLCHIHPQNTARVSTPGQAVPWTSLIKTVCLVQAIMTEVFLDSLTDWMIYLRTMLDRIRSRVESEGELKIHGVTFAEPIISGSYMSWFPQ